MNTVKSWLKLDDARSHLAIMTVVFAALGLTLWLQPGRYHNTPSYANLLDLLPTWGWGLAYDTAAVLSAWCLVRYTNKRLVIPAHTYGIVLLVVWWIAFIIRWVTDGGTTIVNVVSWGVFLYLMTRSMAKLVDDRTEGELLP